MSGIIAMVYIQRNLSQAQATPIVGPLVVSPVKGVVSLAQIIVGIAGTILFGTLALLSWNDTMFKYAAKSLGHVGIGFTGFVYSISNFISLGLVGYRIERMAN